MEVSTCGGGKTVLLLGGYGRAGLPTAELLLEETDARLLVAGRDGSRARETASRLNEGRPEERAFPRPRRSNDSFAPQVSASRSLSRNREPRLE
jgi:NAD(P)-dependent dehydrogenase (short-subunit alcohol dehydrogenase family)